MAMVQWQQFIITDVRVVISNTCGWCIISLGLISKDGTWIIETISLHFLLEMMMTNYNICMYI